MAATLTSQTASPRFTKSAREPADSSSSTLTITHLTDNEQRYLAFQLWSVVPHAFDAQPDCWRHKLAEAAAANPSRIRALLKCRDGNGGK